MWNSLVKGIAGIIFFVFLYKIVRKRKFPQRNKIYFLGLGTTLALGLVISIFPVENFFYSFPSAESLAQYVHKGDVIDIVNGETSSLILYSESAGEVTTMIAPKKTSGYKIANAFSVKIVVSNYDNRYIVEVIHGTSSDDYYVLVRGMDDSTSISVKDSLNSKFITSAEILSVNGNKFTKIFSYALLSRYGDGYQVIIDDLKGTTIIPIKV